MPPVCLLVLICEHGYHWIDFYEMSCVIILLNSFDIIQFLVKIFNKCKGYLTWSSTRVFERIWRTIRLKLPSYLPQWVTLRKYFVERIRRIICLKVRLGLVVIISCEVFLCIITVFMVACTFFWKSFRFRRREKANQQDHICISWPMTQTDCF
jgi:hypothetical protein